jgi:hypothetical protein
MSRVHRPFFYILSLTCYFQVYDGVTGESIGFIVVKLIGIL